MFHHGLARHHHVATQLHQGLTIVIVQPVEQPSPGRVSQCFEHLIHLRYASDNTQLFGYLSRQMQETGVCRQRDLIEGHTGRTIKLRRNTMSESQTHTYLKDHTLSGDALLLDLKQQGASVLKEAAGQSSHAARTLIKDG